MSAKTYSLGQISNWLMALDSPGHTVRGILKYHLSEESIDRANQDMIPNTHVENESRLEDIRTPEALEVEVSDVNQETPY